MPKYRYGKVTFGCFLAKEHWITELNIRSLSHILTYGNVSGPDKSHLKSVLKTLISSEKRMRKELVKQGYMKNTTQ